MPPAQSESSRFRSHPPLFPWKKRDNSILNEPVIYMDLSISSTSLGKVKNDFGRTVTHTRVRATNKSWQTPWPGEIVIPCALVQKTGTGDSEWVIAVISISCFETSGRLNFVLRAGHCCLFFIILISRPSNFIWFFRFF